MSAWVYQDAKQVEKYGEQAAAWCVGWYDPEGKRRCKSCGRGAEAKKNADRLRKNIDAQLLTGTYQNHEKKTWQEFRKEFQARVIEGMGSRNQEETLHALDQFERVVSPKRIGTITSRTVAEFVAKRRREAAHKRANDEADNGRRVSPATINKELRHLRAVFRKAAKWGYLPKSPDFDFLKELQRLPTYISPEDFAVIYHAADQARLPADQAYPAAEWWRGLLVTAYMSGWRIGALLSLRREDVDFEGATALSRAEHNKGKRDQIIHLHPVVLDHLRKLPGFGPVFFPWNYRRATIFTEFGRIQAAAKVKPPAGRDHYAFHDLRRAFATLNADRLTPDALQLLMQHRDYQTTQRYIAMARQLKPAAQNLFVPDLQAKPTAVSG
jgi:integrase